MYFFLYSGGESNWVQSALRPPIGLLCQPRVIMKMEKLVEGWLAGETEVLGENLPQCRFVHHKPHMLRPDANPGRRGGKPATNRLSYGTALTSHSIGQISCLETVCPHWTDRKQASNKQNQSLYRLLFFISLLFDPED
jgi:hypothetical protein